MPITPKTGSLFHAETQLRSFPIMAFASRGEQILLAFGQAQTLRGSLSNICSDWPCGVVPALWLQAIRSFMVAVNRPEPISWITLAAIPLNAVLVYLLVYGKFGLPRLELFGAVLASTLVNCAMFLRFVVCQNASSFP
ncbi:hypothetical protein [Bradyrhizobium sp. CW10]|uniref:hypothetical protein n=1 Tax=Bradyrhizobium sp. CW10 TaxID=2782683 RepID=UPI001FF98F3D|nr:hypothetical protein [Bradyrhizobium sp. CW10]